MKMKDACKIADIDSIISSCRNHVKNNVDEWYKYKKNGMSDTQNMSRVLITVLGKSGEFASEEKIREIMTRMGYK